MKLRWLIPVAVLIPLRLSAADTPVGARVATITINPRDVTVLHLRPEFESTIRMPEEITSVIYRLGEDDRRVEVLACALATSRKVDVVSKHRELSLQIAADVPAEDRSGAQSHTNLDRCSVDHRHVLRQDLDLASKDNDHALRRLALSEDLLTITKIEDPLPGTANGCVFHFSEERNPRQIDLLGTQLQHADLTFKPFKRPRSILSGRDVAISVAFAILSSRPPQLLHIGGPMLIPYRNLTLLSSVTNVLKVTRRTAIL